MTTVKEVAKMVAELSSKFDTFSSKVYADMQEINSSVSFMNTQFEEFKATLERMKQEQMTLKKENGYLKEQLQKTRTELLEIKQYSRQQNLEIKGLPRKPNEKLADAIVEVGKKLDVPLTCADIDVIHRVTSKDKERPNVVVKFVSRSVRDNVLKAAKRQRLVPSDFGHEGNDAVYINEHLCIENKVLLGKATARKKERKWKYTWVANR